MSIGVAILGAGAFARDEHVPAVQASSLLSLKAIYSHSKVAAQKLSQSKDIDWYYDHPSTPRYALSDLLAREDIHAVIIALPLFLQSDLIKKALSAGKHVLSEKPIAEDVGSASELIEWYRRSRRNEIWSVAENFRFLPGIRLGADQLRRIGGTVLTFSMNLFGFAQEDEAFYQAQAQAPGHQGGFLLDSGVHFVAGLRSLLHAADQEISSLTAFTSLLASRLPPVDTIHSTLQLRNGNNGCFNISFGAEFKTAFEIEVVTNKGSVTVRATEVVCVRRDEQGKKLEETIEVGFDNGVMDEVEVFAQSIQNGVADVRGSPDQALADLKVLQRMLESGEQGGSVKVLL